MDRDDYLEPGGLSIDVWLMLVLAALLAVLVFGDFVPVLVEELVEVFKFWF